jgi:hypothetical protein
MDINVQELKDSAKAIIKNIGLKRFIVPFLIMMSGSAFVFSVSFVSASRDVFYYGSVSNDLSLSDFVFSISFAALIACAYTGFTKMILCYLRTGEFSLKLMIDGMKQTFLISLVGSLIVSAFTYLGIIMLLVPGIIISIIFMPLYFVIAENLTDNKIQSVLSKCYELTNGYKMTIFKTQLFMILVFALIVLGLYAAMAIGYIALVSLIGRSILTGFIVIAYELVISAFLIRYVFQFTIYYQITFILLNMRLAYGTGGDTPPYYSDEAPYGNVSEFDSTN